MPELKDATPEEMARCVGLFGTCAGSQWREPFKKELDKLGVLWYDPQVKPGTWKPEDAKTEAEHLAHDGLVLFPVTSESYGGGSLAEVGFSVMQSLKRDKSTLIYIDPTVDNALSVANPVAAKESTRARALVIAHLNKTDDPRVVVASDMESLLALTIIHASKLAAPVDLTQSMPTEFSRSDAPATPTYKPFRP